MASFVSSSPDGLEEAAACPAAVTKPQAQACSSTPDGTGHVWTAQATLAAGELEFLLQFVKTDKIIS